MKLTQAEIDAMRDEVHGSGLEAPQQDTNGGGGAAAPVLDVISRSYSSPAASPSRPTSSARPSPLVMKPLVFDEGTSGAYSGGEDAAQGGGSAGTPSSNLIDEPCTYEVEGIGGRIPKGVSVDINQMGMEEWADAQGRHVQQQGGGAVPQSEPVDTWNLVLDNTPSEMMTALDECEDGVDAVNEMGYTCVMWAALYGKEEHLIVLLECDADVSLALKEDYYSKTYPAGSTALDIARLTQDKTGSDRALIMEMLQAAMDDRWEQWKATEKGAAVWQKWKSKWEKDKQRRERKERERQIKERKRRAQEQAAVDRMRESPYAASVQTVSLWLSSLGHQMGQYAAIFDTHAVDGATLMRLSDQHLKEELKVRTLGQRLRILRARDACKERKTMVKPPFATKSDVGRWLAHIGLQMYSYAFETNDIDGNSLCQLSEAQLRDDLGVRTLGHRLKIMAEREGFREQCLSEAKRSHRRGSGARSSAAGTGGTGLSNHPMDEMDDDILGDEQGLADRGARGSGGSGASTRRRRSSRGGGGSSGGGPSGRRHTATAANAAAASGGSISSSRSFGLGGFQSGFVVGTMVATAFTAAATSALGAWV